MYCEYDNESDAAFIWFLKEDELTPGIMEFEFWPKELKEHIGLLFNSDKKLIGIEVLFATQYLPETLLATAKREE